MKYILFTLAATVIIAMGIAIDKSSRPSAAAPVLKTGTEKIYSPGRVEGATPQIELRPQLAGRVVSVLVTEGQYVEKGEALLQIDNATYRHQVTLAASQLALAEAQLQRLLNGAHAQQRAEATALFHAKQSELHQAQLAWNRSKELFRHDTISQQEADDKRSRVTALMAEVDAADARRKRLEAKARPDEINIEKSRIAAAQANLELARVQLDRTTLRAPQSGQILRVDVEVGELTGAEAIEPTLVMADTRHFYVRAFVEEMDAPRVQLGMTATITADGLPNKKFQGHIIRLSPRMSRKSLHTDKPSEIYDTKTREIWLKLHNAVDLVIGLRVDVVIELCPKTQSKDGQQEGMQPNVPSTTNRKT